MYGLKEGEEFKPWLWRPPIGSIVGQRGLRRKDGYEKVSGKATYTRDMYLPGMLYAKALSSPYPNAKIKIMDTSKAEALSGVKAVLRYDDPDIDWPPAADGGGTIYPNLKLISGEARWYSQLVGALVIAETELIVDEAIRLIEIEWEKLPFIVDWREALEPNAPIIFPDVNPDSNLRREIVEEYGDVEAGLAEAPNVIDVQLNVVEGDTWAGVEGGCCIADYKGDGNVEVWVHIQAMGSYMQTRPESAPQSALQGIKWLTKENTLFLRTHTPCGGATFGGQLNVREDYLFGIIASKAVGKPVKYLYDGSHFRGRCEEVGSYQVTIGFKDNGEVTAAKYHTVMVSQMADQINKIQKSSKIENLYILKTYPWTNEGYYQCYKHGGNACTCHNEVFAQVAAALEMDPTEVAIINNGSFGHDWAYIREHAIIPEGREDRNSLEEVLSIGKAAIDWDNKWHLPGTKILPNGKYHGLGFLWINAWDYTPFYPSVGIRIFADGTAMVMGKRVDIGVNSDSAYSQVVAAEIGLKYEDVVFNSYEQTGFETQGPGGSKGTCGNLPVLVRVARKLKDTILGYALKERPGAMGGPPRTPLFPDMTIDDLDIQKGMIFEKANPENKQPVKEVAAAFAKDLFAYDSPPEVVGVEKMYNMGRQCYFQEVEVDPDTGAVDVKRMVVVNDVGQAISPEACECQQYGGSYMGIGRSKQEQIIWDNTEGVKLTDNLIGYDIAVMNDCGPIDCHLVETHSGYTGYGAFGIGESAAACGCMLTRYAVHNAIGKWVDLKTTPDKILKALGKA